MISIFRFNNYRQFLRSFYEIQKDRKKGFSYALFSKQAGLLAPNYLKLVIEGKRNLSVLNIHQFANALKLKMEEKRYFEALVLFNQSETSDMKTYYRNILSDLRKNKPTRIENSDSPQLFTSWYFPALLVSLHGQSVDFDFVPFARSIGIPAVELKTAIAVLKESSLLMTDDNGIYQIRTEQIVQYGNQSGIQTSHKKKQYLSTQLERSMIAFKKSYEKSGKFYSHTLTAAKADIEFYQSKLNETLAEIIAHADVQSGSKSVMQVNTQMFFLDEV